MRLSNLCNDTNLERWDDPIIAYRGIKAPPPSPPPPSPNTIMVCENCAENACPMRCSIVPLTLVIDQCPSTPKHIGSVLLTVR